MIRQLLARIDDRLHRRLKARAAAEGRSLNALVAELLEGGLAAADQRARVRARLEALGLARSFRPSRRPPSLDTAISYTRGAGQSASEALAAERRRR
jgi:plasmid stability protein